MSDLFVRARPGAGAADAAPPALRLRRPSWRDRRLLAGVLLVLVSTLLGARLLATDHATTPVWVAGHDLAAGTVLAEGDLQARQVRLPGSADRYLDARAPAPTGRVLVAGVGEGELVAASGLAPADAEPATRTVSVPVERWHLPADLARGEVVDVYVTADGSVLDAGATVVVASAVVVAGVEGDDRRFGAGGSSEAVLLTVPEADVARLVNGLARGGVDVVRVPVGPRGHGAGR